MVAQTSRRTLCQSFGFRMQLLTQRVHRWGGTDNDEHQGAGAPLFQNQAKRLGLRTQRQGKKLPRQNTTTHPMGWRTGNSRLGMSPMRCM